MKVSMTTTATWAPVFLRVNFFLSLFAIYLVVVRWKKIALMAFVVRSSLTSLVIIVLLPASYANEWGKWKSAWKKREIFSI
jgi:hypothetical protein